MLVLGIFLTAAASAAALVFGVGAAVLCFSTGVLLAGIFAGYTWRRYEELHRVNEYLMEVLSGNYDMRLAENEEGELSLLKNNLYKVTVLLKSQNEQLMADKKALAEALADISHQLKTPLTSLIMMTDLLRGEENPQKQKEFLEISGHQLQKMQWLILNLLKLSKLDAGTVELKAEPVSMEAVLKESRKPFLVSMELKGIEILTEGEDFVFTGDKNWSVEAVSNIIKNCVEHMNTGDTLKLEKKTTTLYNELVISDTGCGILPEDLPHIFERFYHGKNASSDSVGIGLALAKTILEKERATIEAASREGEGTCFSLKFYKAII